MGGGGFSMETDNQLLDDYVLGLSRRQPARVCFLPTASGDSATYIAKFYRALSSRCHATDLTLNASPGLPRQPAHTRELTDFVREQDVFYVGGGNTANLLALWRLHGLDVALRDAWRAGAVVLATSLIRSSCRRAIVMVKPAENGTLDDLWSRRPSRVVDDSGIRCSSP